MLQNGCQSGNGPLVLHQVHEDGVQGVVGGNLNGGIDLDGAGDGDIPGGVADFDALQLHELQHDRLPCPSLTPGVPPDSRPSSQ